MWLPDRPAAWRRAAGLAVALALAGLNAGCFQPLYGRAPNVQSDSLRDKLATVDIATVSTPSGQQTPRLGIALRNQLQYDFNGGAGPNAPLYSLKITLGTTALSVIVDVASGRPDAQVDQVNVSYQLVEIATGKVVVSDSTYAHVDFDIPGSAQRFAKQRAQRDAEDRATAVVAENIRNRLASYFVAGT